MMMTPFNDPMFPDPMFPDYVLVKDMSSYVFTVNMDLDQVCVKEYEEFELVQQITRTISQARWDWKILVDNGYIRRWNCFAGQKF